MNRHIPLAIDDNRVIALNEKLVGRCTADTVVIPTGDRNRVAISLGGKWLNRAVSLEGQPSRLSGCQIDEVGVSRHFECLDLEVLVEDDRCLRRLGVRRLSRDRVDPVSHALKVIDGGGKRSGVNPAPAVIIADGVVGGGIREDGRTLVGWRGLNVRQRAGIRALPGVAILILLAADEKSG
jgi:hypothetical protein